jgi:hypothetical protein
LHYTDILYCLIFLISFASVKLKLESSHYQTIYGTINTFLYTEFWEVNILENDESEDKDRDERIVSRWEMFLLRQGPCIALLLVTLILQKIATHNTQCHM